MILQTLMQEQIDTLTKLRRRSDAMAVRQDMLQRWPDNMSRIHEMVNLLIQERKSTEGIALLESTLTTDRRWTLDEWNTAFESCLNWRRQRGEFDDGLALCERWIAQCPYRPTQRRHGIRFRPRRGTRSRRAGTRIHQPHAEGRRTFRCDGSASGHRRQSVWAFEHRKVRRRSSRNEANHPLDGSGDPSYRIAAQPNSTQRINLYFTWIQNTELNGAEREAWLQGLRTHLNESLLTMDLERARVLLMTYGQAFDEKTPIDQRQRWSDVLLARWRAADDALSRTEKASFIDEIEQRSFDAAHRLNWLRKQLKEARDAERSTAATALFQRLLAEPWSAEIEVESYELIDQILTADKPNARLAQWLPLLQQWVSSMTSQRIVHHQSQYPKFNELPARQQQHAARECRVEAVREMLEVLKRRAAGRQPSEKEQGNKASQGLGPDARHERDGYILHRLMLQADLADAEIIAGVSDPEQKSLLEEIEKDAHELLGTEPVSSHDPMHAPKDSEEAIAQSVEIRNRHFSFALWLHAVVKLDNGMDDVLNYVRRGIEIDTVAPDAWRAAEFGILIALDRAEE